jgi:hypothetical protein
MKYIAFLLLTFILNLGLNVFAQQPYYPNGKKVPYTFTTIKSVLDSIGEQETESHFYKDDIVYFKRLSNKPIVVFTKNPSRLREIIASYNTEYYKYLNTHSFYWDMNDMIKSGTLTRTYLNEVFGNPDNETVDEEGLATLIFKKYNAKVSLKEDIAQAADVINYKAIDRNSFAISSFSLTSGAYSTGFDVLLWNMDKRTIKYVFVTVTAKNPVNDVIGSKTVKAVGPIKHLDVGSYEFKDVFFSRVLKYVYITGVKIQYMDGTFRTIPKAEINNITMVDWEEVGSRPLD